MPEYLAPGVYIEEIDSEPKPIEGVSTSTTAFVGLTRRGPLAGSRAPEELNSFAAFEKLFGGAADLNSVPKTNYVAHAARAFFAEGGRRLYVARVKSPRTTGKASLKDWEEALNALATWKNVNLIALRPHYHDPKRPRQRTTHLFDRHRPGEAGRVHHLPHRPVDG